MHAHILKYVIFIPFPRQQWFANAPECYIIRTLSVLYPHVTCAFCWFQECSTKYKIQKGTSIIPWNKWYIKAAQIPSTWSPGQLHFVCSVWYLQHNHCISFPYTQKCVSLQMHQAASTRTLQNCGPSACNLLYVTLLAPRIWRWLLDLLKIGVPLQCMA
jgi:hypothetical protein